MKNPNDIFWLARYAHNQLAPIFEQAKAVEPSIHFTITLNFGGTNTVAHIDVYSHWGREGMFQFKPRLHDKTEVDQFATKVREDTEKLQADELANALMAV